MILWLNGPFGAGKTTLADRLRLRKPDLLMFDPEEIGFVVKATVPPAASGDYQDLPLWRALTIAALAELRRYYPQDIVVPMTVVRPDYLDEVLGGARRIGDELLHVFLDLDAELLRDRIERQVMHPDPVRNRQIRQWRLAQMERCLSARERLPDGTLVLDSGNHDPDALATIVLGRMDAAGAAASNRLDRPRNDSDVNGAVCHPPDDRHECSGLWLRPHDVDFHLELTRVWSEPLGLDHIAPSELSRLLGEQGFEFLGGSVAEG